MAPADEPPPEVARALARARRRTAGIEDWKLEHWFRAITRMRRLSAKHALGLHECHDDIIDLPKGSVGQIGHETIRVLERRPRLNDGDEYRGPYIIYADRIDQHIPLREMGELIPRASLPVMVISLRASDEHILAEVNRVIRERKRQKALPRTTGAHSVSRSLRSGHAFRMWQKHHIVELVELLAWRGSDAARKLEYPKHALGFWISPKFETPKMTSEALAVARHAIGALLEIMAEVEKTKI